MELSTYEASQKYEMSVSHLRLLARSKKVKGRQMKITQTMTIWLIDEQSLKGYLKTERKPGRKPKKKSA